MSKRSLFGWSLPPGTTQRMIDEQGGPDLCCEMCGVDPADCKCPECPICSEVGNPLCYWQHGLRIKEQA